MFGITLKCLLVIIMFRKIHLRGLIYFLQYNHFKSSLEISHSMLSSYYIRISGKKVKKICAVVSAVKENLSGGLFKSFQRICNVHVTHKNYFFKYENHKGILKFWG